MSASDSPIKAESLDYATTNRHGETVVRSVAGIGFALMFGALGLIFLGGGLLVGVLVLTNITKGNTFVGRPPGTSAPQVMLYVVLYVAAFGCFGGGAWLIVLAVRHLLGRGTPK